MKKPIYTSGFCLLMAFFFAAYAAHSVQKNDFANFIGTMGITLTFVWFAINAEILVTRVTIRRLMSKSSIEQSKGKYIAFLAILSIPLSFLVKALEWLITSL